MSKEVEGNHLRSREYTEKWALQTRLEAQLCLDNSANDDMDLAAQNIYIVRYSNKNATVPDLGERGVAGSSVLATIQRNGQMKAMESE